MLSSWPPWTGISRRWRGSPTRQGGAGGLGHARGRMETNAWLGVPRCD
jgi:hypothetical protein